MEKRKELTSSLRLYGRRQGRPLRAAQQGLMTNLLPQVRLDLPAGGLLDPREVLPNLQGFWLEIGFGGGEHLAAQAQKVPQTGIIGCEAFLNGIASLLALIDKNSLKNVRIYPGDARFLIERLAPESIQRVFVLFPDPWPKRRHLKRRLVALEFLAQVARILALDGEFLFASDDQAYVGDVLKTFKKQDTLSVQEVSHDPPKDWSPTRYQERALRQGRLCTYIKVKKLTPSKARHDGIYYL